MGKHVHLAAKNSEILVKIKTIISIILAAIFFNSYTVNSYMSSQNALRLIYEIE